MAVGSWIFNDLEFSQSFTVRKRDRTFTEHRFQVIDYKKPAITLTIQGTWKISNGKYCETYTQTSYDKWHDLIGTTRCMDIIKQSESSFEYLSTDSAIVRERKLSKGDARRYTKVPFSFITPEAARSYRIESH